MEATTKRPRLSLKAPPEAKPVPASAAQRVAPPQAAKPKKASKPAPAPATPAPAAPALPTQPEALELTIKGKDYRISLQRLALQILRRLDLSVNARLVGAASACASRIVPSDSGCRFPFMLVTRPIRFTQLAEDNGLALEELEAALVELESVGFLKRKRLKRADLMLVIWKEPALVGIWLRQFPELPQAIVDASYGIKRVPSET